MTNNSDDQYPKVDLNKLEMAMRYDPDEETLIIEFGEMVNWVSLGKAEAIQLARDILRETGEEGDTI